MKFSVEVACETRDSQSVALAKLRDIFRQLKDQTGLHLTVVPGTLQVPVDVEVVSSEPKTLEVSNAQDPV